MNYYDILFPEFNFLSFFFFFLKKKEYPEKTDPLRSFLLELLCISREMNDCVDERGPTILMKRIGIENTPSSIELLKKLVSQCPTFNLSNNYLSEDVSSTLSPELDEITPAKELITFDQLLETEYFQLDPSEETEEDDDGDEEEEEEEEEEDQSDEEKEELIDESTFEKIDEKEIEEEEEESEEAIKQREAEQLKRSIERELKEFEDREKEV